MSTIEHLARRLESYLDNQKVADICRAYHYASEAHEGQKRRSGEPYITHPLAVANILTDMHMDHESLMAALLHDVIEDTPAAKEDIAREFSPEVAELVDGVSKITQIKFETQAEKQAENFQKMMLAMTKDIRVILVKLADRLHNMRTLDVLEPAKRRRIATETLEIYAPIANRLGMNNMRVEFEDLGFYALYPMRAPRIAKAIKKARGNRKEIVSSIKKALEDNIQSEGINVLVIGREKHLYSIYQKMRSKQKSFAEIMDVYGFRIIVNSVDECYRVLGIVHNQFKPVPGLFKDYIAIPKTNGYQSLHTVLKGVSGVPMEIQIRTEEMEAMANNGIAAHWLYKSEDKFFSATQERARQWMQGLLELQKNTGNSMEFIENVKIDLFPDEVYLFSPKGDIIEMPNGATPVDFAYAIHTNIGNSCVATKVDGRLSPLSTRLDSGQTVEIITAPSARPNPSWLNFVVTGKARTNIRSSLKELQSSEASALGERLLEQALSAFGKSLSDIPVERMVSELATAGATDMDEFLGQIGLGNRIASLIARKLLAKEGEPLEDSEEPFPIRGTEGMVLQFARCCAPIPGDAIFGYFSPGRGVVIHRDTCNNFLNELRDNPENCIALEWDDKVKGDFTAEIRVELVNKRGVLATLATTISETRSNIDSISMEDKDPTISIVNLGLSIQDRVHLARVIKRLRALPNVGKITRIKA